MKITNMQIKKKLIKIIIGGLMMNILTSCQAMPSIEYETGIMEKLFEKAGRDKSKMVVVFCNEIKSRTGKSFDSFVISVVREGFTISSRSQGWFRFAEGEKRPQKYINTPDYQKIKDCLFSKKDEVSDKYKYEYILLESAFVRAEDNRIGEAFKKAAIAGNAEAQYAIARDIKQAMNHGGQGEEISWENYYHWLLKAAEGGLPIAQLEVGRLYMIEYNNKELIKVLNKKSIHLSKIIYYLESVFNLSGYNGVNNEELNRLKILSAAHLGDIYSYRYFRQGREFEDDFPAKNSLNIKRAIDYYSYSVSMEPPVIDSYGKLMLIFQKGYGVEINQEKANFYRDQINSHSIRLR